MNRYALLLFLFCWHGSISAQSSDTIDVLFVGNSYTYFYNLPQMVQAMAHERGIALSTRQSTAGGVHLGRHWNGERGLRTVQMIENGQFDLVVLQDHSMRAIMAPDSLRYFGELLDGLVDQHDGQTLLYMTWARAYNPLMQDKITRQYEKLSKVTGARLAPVGKIWAEAKKLRPEIQLYDPDGSHPSPLGTYLTACIFFQVITGESAIGLPHRLMSKDQYGEKIYLSINSRGDAEFCQQLTDRVLSKTHEIKEE